MLQTPNHLRVDCDEWRLAGDGRCSSVELLRSRGLASLLQLRLLGFSLLRDQNRLHAGRSRCLDAEVGVFEDKAICRRYAEFLCREEESVRRGLAVLVVFGTDEHIELVEEAEGSKRSDD